MRTSLRDLIDTRADVEAQISGNPMNPTQQRIIELLTSADLRFYGRASEVARHVGVSRQYVSATIKEAGGREKLGLPDWGKRAVALLRQGNTIANVALVTEHTIGTLERMSRRLNIRHCIKCGEVRQSRRHLYCHRCRRKKQHAS